ncbi:hypothetical protein [Streptococcus hyointestinalis]|uniref:hypothetical protein n=1 Tax=Streptococcus hyointestinalis TaxID=1337 RepID=UPI0013DF519A|nr:hypothetical protein [Streptococcus hyointestinalis]
MISYEKVRRSLKSWNSFIAWVNTLGAVFKVYLIASYFFLLNNLAEIKKMYSASQYQAILASTHISVLVLTIIGLVANITIAYLAFRNRSQIVDSEPDLSPYLIGIIYTVGYNVLSIIMSISLGGSFVPTSLIVPLLFLALYVYVYRKAQTLLAKED